MTTEEPLPTLTPTRGGVGWRLPALAIAVALVGLVALTRLGGSDQPTPMPAPSTVAAVPTPAPAAVPTPAPSGLNEPRVGMPLSPDGLTFADGIPRTIDGQSVYRVRDALSYSVGRTILVGGWYIDRRFILRECAARRGTACASPTISDVPLAGSRDVLTAFVALDMALAITGPYVIRATLENDPRCSIREAGECLPRLHVLDAWSRSLWS